MVLIVYSPTHGTPEFNQSKYSVIKTVTESGSFTIKDVDHKDRAVYFCAVSEHSVITTGPSCTKTHCLCHEEILMPKEGSMT